jgi:hypothetical protein
MKKADLIDQMAQDAEISRRAAASFLDPCADVHATVGRVLCKACHTPVVGPALPFCRDRAPQGERANFP